jgi:CheY-like chemotaxis protein
MLTWSVGPSADSQDRALVDDHAPFRRWPGALLQLEGFEVVGEAAVALPAMEAVGRLRPNVVALDIQLPDLDGIEVGRRLAQAGGSACDRAGISRDSSADRRPLAESAPTDSSPTTTCRAPRSPPWSAER